MDNFLGTLLRVATLAAALGSVLMLAVMLLDLFVPARWNWYNALAFFAATVCLSAARHLHAQAYPPSGHHARARLS